MKVLIIIICFHLVPIRSLSCISSILRGGRRDVRFWRRDKRESKEWRENCYLPAKWEWSVACLSFSSFRTVKGCLWVGCVWCRKSLSCSVSIVPTCIKCCSYKPDTRIQNSFVILQWEFTFSMQTALLMCMHMINSENVNIVSQRN